MKKILETGRACPSAGIGLLVLTLLLGLPSASYAADAANLELTIAEQITEDDRDAPPTLAEQHGVNAMAPGTVSVFVHMNPALSRLSVERAEVKNFAMQRGAFTKYEYKTVMPNVLNLRNIPANAVQGLESMPGVMRVELDEYHENVLTLHDAVPLINGMQSQIGGAGLSADGAGIRICVVDTGIDSDHVMYSGRIDTAAGFDFHNNDSNPEDDNGHGSHVSGIALGGTGLSVDFGCPGSVPFQGIAPEATLIGAKVLNSGGGGFDSNIIAGIDHCADQSPSGGRADVINMSIGIGQYSGNCTHSWAVAANNAVANGVVAVAASGNENYSNAMGSPACGVDVIAVGATYEDSYPNCQSSQTIWNWGSCLDNGPAVDEIVCFSNESNTLDVVGPGCEIWSASNSAGGSSITPKCGTSMSSPMVAGLAALILDVDGSMTPAQVRQTIRDGAIDMGAPGFDVAYGHGRIDVVDTLSLISGCTTNGDCDDGDFCNGAETCSSGSCQSGSDPCPGQGCDEGTDSCVACNNNGTCDAGEDCNSCGADCPSASGAQCGNGICEPGEDCQSCGADCRGKLNGNPNRKYCCGGDPGGGSGPNPIDCSDNRCSADPWACSFSASSFCCGDATCEGGEDENNCAVDCSVTCSGPGDCSDGVACTDDACVSQSCVNTPNDANCPDDGQFCNGAESCDPVLNCVSDGDPCGANETCNEGTDVCDPDVCGAKNDPCSSGADCCSGQCKGNGRCR
jgi:subtilisin family serine protease